MPWREITSDIVYIDEGIDGTIDLHDLSTKLSSYSSKDAMDKRVRLGTFSAASNITGILVDVDAITIMLHRHGFLAFWDYASAGTHVQIDTNPFVKSNKYGWNMLTCIHRFQVVNN